MKAIKKILILCMLFITGCRYQNNMSISNIYTNEDIDEAITCVKTYFKDNYGGCTLIDTYYVGDSYEEEFKEYALIYDVDEAIIISSLFETDELGADGSLNPNETYEDWQWILVRDENNDWQHVDHGY